MSLPERLKSDLSSCAIDPVVVEGVVCEATVRSPWIVSIDRDKMPGKGAYATIRPGRASFFDTFDEALSDAGGGAALPAAGTYYEMVSALSEPKLEIGFKPPLTFVGQIQDIIFLTAPLDLMTSDQMSGLRDAIRLSLREATQAKKIPQVDLRVVLMPEGVKLVRIQEKTS